MKCGIIGLPNIGKSTFFNIISNSRVLSENFPFCTIEPNYGIIKIPDNRLKVLNNIVNSTKITPSEIKIIDIAGLIKGAHKGEGLGNKFLSHIREINVIIHMIRFFDNTEISHVEGTVDPIRDKEIVDMELQLKDLETVENTLKKIYKKKQLYEYKNFLKNIISFLKKGQNIRSYPFTKEYEKEYANRLQLLTIKPILYIYNISELNKKTIFYIEDIKKIIEKQNSDLYVFPLKNVTPHDIEKIMKKIQNLLHLQNFFTVGKNEIRSWIVPTPCTAYEASSYIHTDIQKGFIKAEIIHYNDYITYKSKEKIKTLGKILIVGKKSLINDGDIIHFKFR
ncbi:DUF933 domain-containing protein [Blattabacterium cuenoti]|uniref:DUF933 domain-containing protein n=1 Tax=Blattabacterium cuenoti TaxID=1653831 RepID=UPI00163CBBEF|nr:redox-regulated ATPase YchF [Blattabacterium cuenoti]